MSPITKAAHTPGPWNIVPNGDRFLSIQNEDGKEAVFVSKTRWDGYEEKDGWKREKYTPVESAEADALLIAAASDLLEAACGLGVMPEGYCFCSSDRIGDDSKIHEPECRDLRAAIAKATSP